MNLRLETPGYVYVKMEIPENAPASNMTHNKDKVKLPLREITQNSQILYEKAMNQIGQTSKQGESDGK